LTGNCFEIDVPSETIGGASNFCRHPPFFNLQTSLKHNNYADDFDKPIVGPSFFGDKPKRTPGPTVFPGW
jgi:hypothetical protein